MRPVGVRSPNLATVYAADYGAQAAIAAVQLMILVLIFHRRIASGLPTGAVEG